MRLPPARFMVRCILVAAAILSFAAVFVVERLTVTQFMQLRAVAAFAGAFPFFGPAHRGARGPVPGLARCRERIGTGGGEPEPATFQADNLGDDDRDWGCVRHVLARRETRAHLLGCLPHPHKRRDGRGLKARRRSVDAAGRRTPATRPGISADRRQINAARGPARAKGEAGGPLKNLGFATWATLRRRCHPHSLRDSCLLQSDSSSSGELLDLALNQRAM